MRKGIVSLVLVGMLATANIAPSALAQEATPGSAFADLGLPELNVSVTATTLDGIPETLEAGRYLLTVTVADDLEFGGGVEFLQPVGIPIEEFVAGMAPPPEEGAASPAADAGMATPGNGEDAGIPAFLFESIYAGGISAPPGGTVQGVIDLGPGQWVAHGGFESTQPPTIVDVTGELPTDLPEPEAGATLTMGEYVIEVTEGELVAGTQVVKIENIGAQPHFIVAGYTEVAITEEDVAAVLEADMTGTPAAVAFDPDEDFSDAFFTGVQSTGTTMWVTVSLEPATYVFLCFFPDLGDGLPHANHGMFEIVEVGG